MAETNAKIAHISCHLPDKRLTNEDLVRDFGTWTPHKIKAKTGITERRVVKDELVSDMGKIVAERLFEETGIDRSEIDMLLLCTETPDFIMPSTACLIHKDLGLKKSCGALDYNLGCSGYLYGLYMASAMVRSKMAGKVLLITGDILTRYVNPGDKSTRTIFGDGFTATLIEASSNDGMGNFIIGTDGTGVPNLIIPAGGAAKPCSDATKEVYRNKYGNTRTDENLYMNGPEVFKFANLEVPPVIASCLNDNNLTMNDIDLVVFHQATEMMLDKLRKDIGIPEDKFYINLEDKGNTVSSTIPLGLRQAQDEGKLKKGDRVLICGFGIGYSWGATVLTW